MLQIPATVQRFNSSTVQGKKPRRELPYREVANGVNHVLQELQHYLRLSTPLTVSVNASFGQAEANHVTTTLNGEERHGDAPS
jgi:hypothetical protein